MTMCYKVSFQPPGVPSRSVRHPAHIQIFFLLLLIAPITITSSEWTKRSVRSVMNTEIDTKYVVICDAGSSGTRVIVYTLKPMSGELLDIDTLISQGVRVQKEVEPGLSTYANKSAKVLDYITPLVRFAEENIPAQKLAETDLFIFATAGMRLIPENKKNLIIEKLQTGLKKLTALRVTDSNIRVIDGAWEGIYSWLTVNYVLGRFKRKSTSRVGMIDMGGASAQIAFEVPAQETSYSGADIYEINLSASDVEDAFKFRVYSKSFLGYGINEGLKKYEQSLVQSNTVNDSCSPEGMSKLIGELQVTGTGEWNTCLERVSSLICSSARTSCPSSTCFLNNVAAPSVNLSNIELYGFSEYWYTMNSFGAGGEYHYEQFTEAVRKYCHKNWNDIMEGYKRSEYPNGQIERLKTNCFKAAWLTAMLHNGFNVDETTNQFQSVLTIAGEKIQWALGAALYHSRDLKFVKKEEAEDHSKQPTTYFYLLCIMLIFVLGIVFYHQLQKS